MLQPSTYPATEDGNQRVATSQACVGKSNLLKKKVKPALNNVLPSAQDMQKVPTLDTHEESKNEVGVEAGPTKSESSFKAAAKADIEEDFETTKEAREYEQLVAKAH